MGKSKFLLLLFLAVMLCFSNLLAQKRKVEKADEAFYAGEYFDAVDLYKDAYSRIHDRTERTRIAFQIGECYYKMNESKYAKTWFKKAVTKEYHNPVAILRYAEVLKMEGKYEDAINEYNHYKQLVPDDFHASDGILSCELALQWIDNPTGYKVEGMKYINSRNSDFSPAFARDDYRIIIFTSARDESSGNDVHGGTGQNFTDLYETKMDRKGKWSTPVPIEELNTEYEEGTPAFTSDYNTMYFTRCVVSKRKKLGCAIFKTVRTGSSWSNPEPVKIADDSLIVAHPSVSDDGMTMYFASDMPDGFGGKDLWMVTRTAEGADWSNPENLGEDINTEGDEMFPFIHPDGTLYFSSDYHLGMGGLDIFQATRTIDGGWKVGNMKYPVNSSADDFGIVIERDSEKGFFSSTRRGRGNDEIYSFILPPLKFNLIGVVRDEESEEPLATATVKLIGSDGMNIETETGEDGSFKFMLKSNTDYIFIGSKRGYLNNKGRETTKGQNESKDFQTTILLSSIDNPIEISNIFYDFAKWDLRPESMVSLDKLVETLLDNPHVTIELISHTDSRDTEEFNQDLSQKRAQSVVDYLIEKGIVPDRLSAKGYGESRPKVIDTKLAKDHAFIKEEDILDEAYINKLTTSQQKEIAHQINRRTEFQVLRTDYESE